MVAIVIVSHSAQLAAGIKELADQMAQGQVAIAAVGGTNDGSLGTAADKIHAAIESVYGPDGVVVLMDLGSAIMSTEVALDLLTPEQRTRVRLADAPVVEGAVVAAVGAMIGQSLDELVLAVEESRKADKLTTQNPQVVGHGN